MVTLFFQTCSWSASVAAWSSVEIIAKDSLEEHRKWQRIAGNKHDIYKHSNLNNPQTSERKRHLFHPTRFSNINLYPPSRHFAGGTPDLGTITMSSHDFWCHIMWSSNPWATSISHDMTRHVAKKTTYPKHSFWLILRYFKVTSILFRNLLLRSLLVRKDYTSYTKKHFGSQDSLWMFWFHHLATF